MDVRKRWSRDEERWWYSHAIPQEGPDYIMFKVTEGGEEKPFGLPDDKSELQVADAIQYATHIDISFCLGVQSLLRDWMTKFSEVLQTADDLVPSLEALKIYQRHERWPVSDAIKSKKLSNLKSLALTYSNLRDVEVKMLASAIDAAYLPFLKHLKLERLKSASGDIGHISLAKVMESGRMLALETLSLKGTAVKDAGCEAYANAISSGKLSSLTCLNLSQDRIGIEGIKDLGRAIASGELKNLTEFDLSNACLYTDRGRGHFVSAEHMGSGQMRALERLNLEHNLMTGEDCEAYANAIIFWRITILELYSIRVQLRLSDVQFDPEN